MPLNNQYRSSSLIRWNYAFRKSRRGCSSSREIGWVEIHICSLNFLNSFFPVTVILTFYWIRIQLFSLFFFFFNPDLRFLSNRRVFGDFRTSGSVSTFPCQPFSAETMIRNADIVLEWWAHLIHLIIQPVWIKSAVSSDTDRNMTHTLISCSQMIVTV